MTVLANRLNKRITIQEYTTTRNDEGMTVETWVDLATVWAAKRQVTGREYFEAAAVQAENTVRFEIRYRDDVEANMRVVHDGKTYEIVSPPIDPDGKRKELHLMCREVVSGG